MIDRMIVIGVIIFSAIVLSYSDFSTNGKVYNCSIAEFHPDYPKAIKEECRKLIEEYRRHEEQKEGKIYI